MKLSIVVAIAGNGVIGKDGGLPWRLPADLAHFREITMGHPIVMGRLTHESIGRPLPGRPNIVVSSTPSYRAEGCQVISTLDALGDISSKTGEFMIIGGARLYEESLAVASRLYLTEVHAEPDGDVFFPDYDRSAWKESAREFHQADDRNEYDYSYVVLDRS